ncbi:class I SAM-dependent methyltransferase [Salinispira pacifica]
MQHSRPQSSIEKVDRPRAAAAEVYNRLSPFYDLLAGSERAYIQNAVRLLDLGAGERVLEIGSGTGQTLVQMAHLVGKSGEAVGVDIAQRMCERALRRAAADNLGENVRVLCADAVTLPFPDRAFNAVLLSFTLELFSSSDMGRVLTECRRVLRSDGRLAVVSLSRIGAGTAVRVYEWMHRRFPRAIDCRPIEAAAAVEGAGFSIEFQQIERMWGLPVEIISARNATP